MSLGCERLPTPLKKKKKKKKVLDHYLHHDLGMLPLLRCVFAHLLILQYPDHHQNLISSYLYYSGPVHKISSQSVHNFLSNVVHRQTNKQTNRQTNATKNITSFAKEVINNKTHIKKNALGMKSWIRAVKPNRSCSLYLHNTLADLMLYVNKVTIYKFQGVKHTITKNRTKVGLIILKK